jgi:hypothetical protein
MSWCSAASSIAASDVAVSLQVEKQHYKVGESINFEIVYTNTSSRPVCLLPQSETFGVDILMVKPLSSSQPAEKIPLRVTVDRMG